MSVITNMYCENHFFQSVEKVVICKGGVICLEWCQVGTPLTMMFYLQLVKGPLAGILLVPTSCNSQYGSYLAEPF